MPRPNQVFRVFAELRVIRPDVPAWQALRLAEYIVRAHREPESFSLEEAINRPPFFALDVDKAFRYPWDVLNFEQSQGMLFCDDVSEQDVRAFARLWTLVGRP